MVINQSYFQKIILFINAYLEIWSPSIFPYCCVIEIIDDAVKFAYCLRLMRIYVLLSKYFILFQDQEKAFYYAS